MNDPQMTKQLRQSGDIPPEPVGVREARNVEFKAEAVRLLHELRPLLRGLPLAASEDHEALDAAWLSPHGCLARARVAPADEPAIVYHSGRPTPVLPDLEG